VTKRKSFIIHHDSLEVLSELTDEQAGQLFKAILSYKKTGKHDLKGILNAVFIPFKNQFDRDDEKYENISERNKINGGAGGRPKLKDLKTVRGKKIPREIDDGHFIYLMYDQTTGEFKIGETINLVNRRQTIKRPTANLQIYDFYISTMYQCQELERDIRDKYRDSIISGDWLAISEDQALDICDYICEKTQSVNLNPKKPDNDNDNDNDNDKEKIISKKNNILKPDDVSQIVWEDFLKLRKEKKAPLTETALRGIEKQASKINWTLERALEECCQRGWVGFNHNWIKESKNEQRQLTHAERADAALARAIADSEAQHENHSLIAAPELRYLSDIREASGELGECSEGVFNDSA
jgi:hypothetical protein